VSMKNPCNLLPIIIAPLLAVCFFTGGALSPFRFAYLPIMIMISIRLPPRVIFLTGTLFACGFAVMVTLNKPADMHTIAAAATEFVLYLLTAWTAASVATTVSKERALFRISQSTFQGLCNDLTIKANNLQATLDTLTLVQNRLKNTDRCRTLFLGNIAHELRTPLSGIRAFSEILLTHEDLDMKSQREFLNFINNDCIRMATLVNDILTSLKIQTGNLEHTLNKVGTSELINECIIAMRPMAIAKGLTLESSITSDNIFINADKNQVIQVLINLINNAIKYTDEGGVTVGVGLKGCFAEFFVIDSGEGIFPSEQKMIFDEFYRVLDNAANRPIGSGLGLSICKKIVEVHGGMIGVESSIGNGSTFRFTIPIFNEKPFQMDESGEMVTHQHKDSGRILLIARHLVKCLCLTRSLEDAGYKVITTYNYEKAHDILMYTNVNLIISDLGLTIGNNDPLLSQAASKMIPFYQSYFHVEPPGIINQFITGYIWSPFNRSQILPILETLNLPRKKICIISSNMEESRILQTVLSFENYKTELLNNNDEFFTSRRSFLPEAIIIGTFETDQIDLIVDKIKSNSTVANVPLILALKAPPPRDIKLITAPAQGDTSLLFGISPLVQIIEEEMLK